MVNQPDQAPPPDSGTGAQPAAAGPSNPFQRTRVDHDSETAEDYVELVADLIATKGEARITDMAKRLAITTVSVTKAVARLQKAGFLQSEPYRSVFLTEQGEQLARHCKERHQVVLNFLLALGVPKDAAAQDAEGMEHHISLETLNAMRRFLDKK